MELSVVYLPHGNEILPPPTLHLPVGATTLFHIIVSVQKNGEGGVDDRVESFFHHQD
jgi:hypothetical protein